MGTYHHRSSYVILLTVIEYYPDAWRRAVFFAVDLSALFELIGKFIRSFYRKNLINTLLFYSASRLLSLTSDR